MTVSISPHRTDGAAQTPAEPKKPTRTPRADASTVRPRRDWRIIALGLILATLASLGATYFVRRAGTPQSTLVLVRAVGAGQVINRSDLGVVKLTGAEQLGTLSPEQSTEVVGRRAAADLPANSLLNRADITAALAPRAGDNLVGVALKPGQMPVSGIAAGDIVRARAVNAGLLPLLDAQRALGGVSMSKAALELIGIPAGAPRLPQLPPTTEQRDALASLLVRAGVIT